MLENCESTFDIDAHILSFIQECVFFVEISKNIKKIPTKKVSTIAISYDKLTDQIVLYFNPEYMLKWSNRQVYGLLTHEFYHFSLGHLTTRLYQNIESKKYDVIAKDLAINSLILHNKGTNHSTVKCELPPNGYVPGEFPKKENGSEYSTKEIEEFPAVTKAIAKFKKLLSSEHYYQLLSKIKEEKNKSNQLDHQFDDHDLWDIGEEDIDRVEQKIKLMIKSASEIADATYNGWGSIPSSVRSEIKHYITNKINWQTVLRQFVGQIVRGSNYDSIKRINRKYPYIHPGIVSKYSTKLLIAQDQSNSVTNEMLEIFFGEIWSLSKHIEIDYIPFDSVASEDDIITLKKGIIPTKASVRTKNGGTDFNAPTNIFNDSKNKNRWDGLIIITDGQCTKPISCKKKRAWVTLENQKLYFEIDELHIKIPNDK